MTAVVGLDIGGSSLKLGAWRNGERLAWRAGIAVPDSNEAATVAGCLTGLVRLLAADLDQPVSAVGVGACGILHDGVIYQSPNTPWERLPLVALLEDALALPVSLINDADAFLLDALATLEPVPRCAIGLTLGTGIGTAIWLNGGLLAGGTGISPEGGHITVQLDGAPGNTGIPGSWESLAGRNGLLALYREAGGSADDPRQIAERAAAGEPAALSTWERYGERLAAGLGSLCNIFTPQQVLFGGGIAGAQRWFESSLERSLDRYVLHSLPRPTLSFVADREDTVARGAARSALLTVGGRSAAGR